jgi:fatty-acid peroxygenase
VEILMPASVARTAASPRRPDGIPRLSGIDHSLSLLREGYAFISSRCDRLGTDAFRTRLMFSRVICMRGADAAEIVYDSGHFDRAGAVPKSTLRLLQDEGSVQQLSGGAHRARKAMFMGMMTPAALDRAREIFAREFRAAASHWQGADHIVVHEAIREVLTRSVCAWAGVPLGEDEVEARSREISAMIDRAGSIGPLNWWARRLRNRTEAWARDVVERTRKGEIVPEEGTPLALIAAHPDADGQPLDRRAAGVELLNVLRPTVAVGRFITFGVLALSQFPVWREAFAAGELEDLEPFVQEVRRFYPFFPAVGARACEPFEWHGHGFAAGDWVLLDLYGTNHDARIWEAPEAFRPERFRRWQGNPYTLIPQGAGAFETGHRCPGEWLTIILMKEAIRLFSQELRYEVPMQDLTISLSAIPALPKSGLVLREVRAAA